MLRASSSSSLLREHRTHRSPIDTGAQVAPPVNTSALLQEDGVSYILLEDGSKILLE